MAIGRTIGIILALGIFAAGVILFVIMPTLEFRGQRNELMLIANQYEKTWETHREEVSQYNQYAKLIDTQKTELQTLETLLKRCLLNPIRKDTTLTVAGIVDANAFSEIMSFFGNSYILEVNHFTAANTEKMPILISEPKASTFNITKLEVKMLQYNEKLLKR
jgi:hypothetical protein